MRPRGPSWPPSFPPREQWQEIEPLMVQSMFRNVFQEWGLPLRVRVDNGHPWGTMHDLPRELALWLIGLDIAVIWNPPRTPQNNGKVERTQGVTQQWVEPAQCADAADLQARLAWAIRVQREEYPAVKGRSRLAAFPLLRTPRRPYTVEQEPTVWEVERVERFLAEGAWWRHVGASGQISLYGHDYTVGKAFRGRDVEVRFDPSSRQWIISDEGGEELRRHPAAILSRDRIL